MHDTREHRRPSALRQLVRALQWGGKILLPLAGLWLLSRGFTLEAQVPSLLNFQGRLVVRGDSFDGTGQFKMALVNADASSVYWRNAPDANADGEPDAAVSLPVNRGIYSIALGDTSLANMAALPATVFANSAVYLRLWFSDGVTGFQRLSPDQRIASVGYAMIASSVADGVITKEKLSPDLAAEVGSFTAVSSDAQDASLASRGYVVFMNVPAPSWVNGATTSAPSARSGHTAVWTGQDLLVWGGDIGQGNRTSSGGAYQPLSDQWSTLSPLNAPTARSGHSAAWTGSEMIVWGGATSSAYENTGGRFDPASQNWSALSTAGAPSGRQGNVAVWTGSRFLVWGGLNATGLLADGAQFDPATGQWSALNAANPPSARHAATAVWAGDRLIVWGGQGPSTSLNTGAQLLFSSGVPQAAWQALAASGAPSARDGHTAIWTGQKMIIWGGRNGGAFLSDGAAYDPVADTWSALPAANAPSARADHSAVWTGSEMIVFGGENSSGALSSGAAYNPALNQWRTLANPGSPVARSLATALWSGTEMLIFGGQANSQPLASLQKVSPQPAWYFYRKP